MSDRRPLTTLLSQVLVAFAIECDNEAERRITLVTQRKFFLVSLPMWANYLQFVEEDGIRVDDLRAYACVSEAAIRSRLKALSGWRYVEIEPNPADDRKRPPLRDWRVRPTRLGRFTRRIWRPIVAEVEARYRKRFGAAAIDRLRETLDTIVAQTASGLPGCLPVVGYNHFAHVDRTGAPFARPAGDLPALLSRTLLAFTLEFEAASEISMPLGANVLRVLDAAGVPLREIPIRTGIARETAALSLRLLERSSHAVVDAAPAGSRGSSVRLTPSGVRAQAAFHDDNRTLETRWRKRFGATAIDRLRASLATLLDDRARLAAGLIPPPGGWRERQPYAAQTRAILADPAAALPHYPIVTHRGGWLDGS